MVLPNFELLAPPQWLVSGGDRREAAATGVGETLIPEGRRNIELARTAGRLRHAGLSAGAIVAALLSENNARCHPPLPEDEVRKVANGILRYPAANDRRRKYRLIGESELQLLPKPEWTIDNILPAGGLEVLYGPPGAGKSFVALDMAMSIAAGEFWAEERTKTGVVIYVAAEGVRGMQERVASWRSVRGIESTDRLFVMPEPVQIADTKELDAALLIIEALPTRPALVVVDTLARCFVGSDENTSREMGEFVQGVDHIRSSLGAGVLVVHHTGKDGRAERGSNALRGAADTMIEVRKRDEILTVTCDKMKDASCFHPKRFRLATVGSSWVPQYVTRKSERALNDTGLRCLRALNRDDPTGVSFTDWLEASEMSRSTFNRYREGLLDGNYVSLQNETYRLTQKGEMAAGFSSVPPTRAPYEEDTETREAEAGT